MRNDTELGLESSGVAADLAERLGAAVWALTDLLKSPIGRVAAAGVVRPEIAFVDIAVTALSAALGAPDGLDSRCEDLRQECNRLEELLHATGEAGDLAESESEAGA